MKVLIVDRLSPTTVTALERMGLKVEVRNDLKAETLPGAVADVNILIVRSTKVTAATIQAAPQLSLIIRAGAGVDTIDIAAASGRGIYVANCPGKNTLAVAELAIGLLIAADRRIVEATNALRAGAWKKKEFGDARGLAGRTLGILGYGAIGRAVAHRARALEMKIAAWSPLDLTAEEAQAWNIDYCYTPEELAAKSDAVTVHLALTPETKHLVGKKFFDAMKPGAIFINTSRGPLVDTTALVEAIKQKKLRVGMDVFENEPAGGEAQFPHTELAALVTCTPHIGASTDQAAEAIAAEVVRIIDVYLKTGRPPGTVNLCERSPATHRLVMRLLNQPGILAFILDGLRDEGINVAEVENIVFTGAQAGCCSLGLDRAPSDKLLGRFRENANILNVVLQPCN